MNPLLHDNFTDYDSPIIVALDYDNELEVINLISTLNPTLCKLKVGKQLFTACGPNLVEKLVVSGYKVFLDLKFHDIPHTVYKACKVASNLGIWMLNVHASGGQAMLEMAYQGVNEAYHKPLLVAVTALTSMQAADLKQVGIKQDMQSYITNLAKLAYTCQLDGVVCAAQEAKLIKNHTHNQFLTVSPGIRLNLAITDDQQRIMQPLEAIKQQVDYLVIGRPITQAKDPAWQLQAILAQIKIAN